MPFARPSGRAPDQMRGVSIDRGFTRHAEGSVLVAFGDTRVLCTASVDNKVPPFLRGKGGVQVSSTYVDMKDLLGFTVEPMTRPAR